MAEGLTRRVVVTSRDDGAILNDGSIFLDEIESGRHRGVRTIDRGRIPFPPLKSFEETTTFTSLTIAEASDANGDTIRQQDRKEGRASSPRSMFHSCLSVASTLVATAVTVPIQGVSCIKCSTRRKTATSSPLRQSKIQRDGGWENEWSVVGRCCQYFNSRASGGEESLGRGGELTNVRICQTTGSCIRQLTSLIAIRAWRKTSAVEKEQLFTLSRDLHYHSLHVQSSTSPSTSPSSASPYGVRRPRRLSSSIVQAFEETQGPWLLEESLHNDVLPGENLKPPSEKKCEKSMSAGPTGETSLDTDDSAEHFNVVTTTSISQQPPRPLIDFSLFKVNLQEIQSVQHHSDINIAFHSSLDASESDDDGSYFEEDETFITQSSVKATLEQNPSDQVKNSVGTHTKDVPANSVDDCVTSTATKRNDNSGSSNKIHFFLRLPSADSLKQDQMAKVERAERTADFMETAKALSLTLSRNRWSRRRPQRSASSSSQTSTTVAAAPATIAALGRCRLNHSPVPAGEELKGTAEWGRRAPPRRTISHKINRPQNMLEIMADPTTTSDKADCINNYGWSGKYSPRKRQQGYVVPFPIPPLSRENSVENLHQLLEQEQAGSRRSPLRLNCKFRISQEEQRHQHQQPNDLASMSVSETEHARQRFLLGYEEIDVPLKNEGHHSDDRVDYGFVVGDGSSKAPNTSQRNGVRTQRRHGAFGTANQEPSEEVITARTQKRRVQRRRSFVSGSKIERFDEQIHHQSHNSSGAVYTHSTHEEAFGGGMSRIPPSKRSSLSSGSMSIESYNEWKNEMMAQNG